MTEDDIKDVTIKHILVDADYNDLGLQKNIKRWWYKMSDNLSFLLEIYREAVARILGNRLKRIILYGSYARGDFRQDSDIDIMILADIQPEEISIYADKIYDVTYDFEMQCRMEINPSIQSVQIYEQWKNVYPFFINVEKDGVAV